MKRLKIQFQNFNFSIKFCLFFCIFWHNFENYSVFPFCWWFVLRDCMRLSEQTFTKLRTVDGRWVFEVLFGVPQRVKKRNVACCIHNQVIKHDFNLKFSALFLFKGCPKFFLYTLPPFRKKNCFMFQMQDAKCVVIT